MALFDVDTISFNYQRQQVLKDLSLSIEPGGVLTLLGPNGSGKTTLLKLLLGLLRPKQGQIRLNGENLRAIPPGELARTVAYVPQVHREAFGYRVYDVVLMGRIPHTSFFSRYGEADHRIASEALKKLSIGHLADRPYTEVSGGERQLTLIARSLAQGARIFIMDEPVNGLDYGNQLRLLDRIRQLSRVDGFTFIMTTHHPDHAKAVADRVIMMQQGRILHDGPPNATITPGTLMLLYDLDARLLTANPPK